jgi:hypothetical protein
LVKPTEVLVHTGCPNQYATLIKQSSRFLLVIISTAKFKYFAFQYININSRWWCTDHGSLSLLVMPSPKIVRWLPRLLHLLYLSASSPEPLRCGLA